MQNLRGDSMRVFDSENSIERAKHIKVYKKIKVSDSDERTITVYRTAPDIEKINSFEEDK